MKIEQIKTFEDLERYLRDFANFSGDRVPYDFNGILSLFLALLDNLARNHLDADIEPLEELQPCFTDEQREFLKKLCRLI